MASERVGESKASAAVGDGAKAAQAKSNDDELLAALGALYPRRGRPVARSVGYLDTGEQGTVFNISMQSSGSASTWNRSLTPSP